MTSSDIPELPTQANRHFMGAVVNMADRQEVVLSEDVYSEKGVKLLAKGAKVSSTTYEKVVSHRLSKPIESSLVSAEQPSGNLLVRIGEEALETYPLLANLCNWSQGRVTALGMLAKARLNPAAGTLLNVTFERSEHAPRHAVMTSMIAMSLANAHAYNDHALMAAVCLGGLFHDAGELYVDPAVMQAGRQLTANEWMSYAYHPVIGAALAREICGFDGPTQRSILEHHEADDGFGYPRGVRGRGISTGGKLMSLAEILAALIVKPSAEDRIAIALKVMPTEHESALTSIIHELLRESRQMSRTEVADDDLQEVDAKAQEVFMRIAEILGVYDSVMQTPGLSQGCKDVMTSAFDRFILVQRAYASTGIAALAELGASLSQEELRESRFEAQCVLHEIAWRMLKISRELVLKAAKFPPGEAQAMNTLAHALAGTQGAAVAGMPRAGVTAEAL
ncbi:HD-GYP domain-containing protein [Viridibacterium curvum]|uniref:HD-GYP domain-containing protein n=1 Tax=Viridibacterium curvum TaxID=1101404 RepID=A0ABP9Q8H7_9RHOO